MIDAQGTARLGLPLLQPGQAQKEMGHNAALAALDLAVQASVLDIGRDVPPPDPEAGACWIVGTHPVGDWAGRAGAIAGWTTSGWRFAAAFEGLAAWCVADAQTVRYTGGGWVLGRLAGSTVSIGGKTVVGERRAAITRSSDGTVIDAEARAAIDAILAVLRGHGLIEI